MADTRTQAPHPLTVAWSVLRVLATVRSPRPTPGSTAVVDHEKLSSVLAALGAHGVAVLPSQRATLAEYRVDLENVDPDDLSRPEALAYWLNLYNAGALDLAAEAYSEGSSSVLRLPGGFRRPWAVVAGVPLSLDAIEHAKLRRLKDPRIHGALVCGSVSCPTLRYEPYTGDQVVDQLDAQMTDFFVGGGAILDGTTLCLSRILLWFGADFVRPRRMPAFLPVRKDHVAAAVTPWLPKEIVSSVQDGTVDVAFQPYDWSLACSLR